MAMSGAPSDSYLCGLFRTASAGNIARKFLRARKVAERRAPKPKPKKLPKPIQSPQRDQVAEMLSIGLELDQIAERMGITRKAVKRHLETIRERLGPQAV